MFETKFNDPDEHRLRRPLGHTSNSALFFSGILAACTLKSPFQNFQILWAFPGTGNVSVPKFVPSVNRCGVSNATPVCEEMNITVQDQTELQLAHSRRLHNNVNEFCG